MEHPENSKEYKGLTVNAGVEQPSTVNPYLNRGRYKRREMTVGEIVEGILRGNVTVLSQAVTLIESVNPDHYAKAQEVIEKCLPHSGNSIRIGISGVPGAGKSTSGSRQEHIHRPVRPPRARPYRWKARRFGNRPEF